MDTLGFDWSIYGGGVTYMNPHPAGDHFLKSDTTGKNTGIGKGSFQMGVGKNSPISTGLRFAETFFSDTVVSDGLMSVYTILGNYAFETVIHAIEQETHTDVLSSPKVTTISGKTAQLKMVKIRYFPESWTEPEIETDTGDAGNVTSYTPSIPELGEETELGVILDVTPNVSADEYSVDLDLIPQVIDFVDWEDYSYSMIISGQTVSVPMKMPILSKREVNTKVIVYDNETIVLGGMVGERMERFDDRIPLLGSIPILGRLFTSKGERGVKTNLMIFVNVRLVKPDGQPVRANEVRGLYDFKH
jgi:general secretion pathway protein D